MTVLEELEEIFILRTVKNDYKERERGIVWDKFDFLFNFIRMFAILCLFSLFLSLLVSLLLIGWVENINLDKVFFSIVGLVFCFTVGFVLSDMKKNKKKMLSYLEDLESIKHKMNIKKDDRHIFGELNKKIETAVRNLLSDKDKMGELYKKIEKEDPVFMDFKKTIEFVLDYQLERKNEKENLLKKFTEKGYAGSEGSRRKQLSIEEANG